MKIVEKIVKDLKKYFIEKNIIEIACGNADFSLTVSQYAKSVIGIDVSLERIEKRNIKTPINVKFIKMDATKLKLNSDFYDVALIYNAISHLESNINNCISEMHRIVKKDGHLIFIATWKMDKKIR